jgi:hypothetical protein
MEIDHADVSMMSVPASSRGAGGTSELTINCFPCSCVFLHLALLGEAGRERGGGGGGEEEGGSRKLFLAARVAAPFLPRCRFFVE